MSAGAQLRDPGRVVIGFALGLVPSAAIAWGQAFYDWSIVPHAGAAGLFLNREVLAETAAPIAVCGVIRRGWIGMAVCALASIPLAICQSRVSVGAAAVALVLMAPIRRRAKVSILALVVLAGSIALITMGIGKFGSGMQRIVLWGAAILTLDPRGQGLGWWASVHMQPNEEYVHSDVLQIFVELGLPGVLLLIAPAAALRGPSTPERAALATIAIESVVSFPLHTPAVAFLAAVLAGGILRAWADVRLAELVGRARNVLGALRWKGALAAGVVRSRARELSEVSMGAHFWAHHFRGSAHGSGELRE